MCRESRTFYWESIKGDSFPEANFLDEFLMKSCGLLSAFAPIFSAAAAELVPVWLREPCRLPYSWRLKKRGVLCSGATWKRPDTECTEHYKAEYFPPSKRVRFES